MQRFESKSLPFLLVLSWNKIEAETCIESLAELYGTVERDSVSVEDRSLTERFTRHTFRLNGKDIELVSVEASLFDYDAERKFIVADAFLKLLERTSKSPFYPPLVIIEETDDKVRQWFEHLRLVFPSVVCAVRCAEEAFETVVESFSESTLSDVPLFPVGRPEIVEDDGIARAHYVDDLKSIGGHYSTLTPSRNALDLSSEIFKGDYEHLKIRTETDAKDEAKEEVVSTLENRTMKCRKVTLMNRKGYLKSWYDMNQIERTRAYDFIAQAFASIIHEKAWVPLSEEAILDEPHLSHEEVTYLKTSVVRTYFKRNVTDVYKILHNGMRIFCREVNDEWEKVREQVINEDYARLPPS